MYFGTNSHLFMRIRRRAPSPANVFQRDMVESVESPVEGEAASYANGGVTASEPCDGHWAALSLDSQDLTMFTRESIPFYTPDLFGY